LSQVGVIVNVPFLIVVFVYHPQTADPNGTIKCPFCQNDCKDIVTVPVLSAPPFSSTPSPTNPSGVCVKASLSAVHHGRSSESIEIDGDLHEEVQVCQNIVH